MVWGWIVDGIARLLVQLKLAVAGMAGRVLSAFGLTIVTFNSVLPNLKSYIVQFTGGLSPEASNLLGYLCIGVVMSMILSALTIRLAWKVFIIPTSVANQLGAGS